MTGQKGMVVVIEGYYDLEDEIDEKDEFETVISFGRRIAFFSFHQTIQFLVPE